MTSDSEQDRHGDDVVLLAERALAAVKRCVGASAAPLAELAEALALLCPLLSAGPARSTLERAHKSVSKPKAPRLDVELAERVSAVLERIVRERAPAATAKSAPAADVKVERDAETVDLFGDFLQEAEEGLDRAEAVLLEVEQSGGDPERVNLLFRVFHTIKGVAGCLEINDITQLGHTTETLLDEARSGTLELSGTPLQLVFESATAMRKLLGNVRRSVESATALEQDHSVFPLVKQIESALGGAQPAAVASKPAVVSAPVDAEELFPNQEEELFPPPAAPLLDLAPAPQPPAASAPAVSSDSPRSSANGSSAESVAQPAQKSSDAEEPAPEASGKSKLRETVKVDLERVDSVVDMIGELIIVESMVVNAPEIVGLSSIKLRNYLNQLSKISRDLQDVAMRMRMVPVRGVFQKMARMARELSHKTGKPIVLTPSGEGAEMDRSMVERIEDPLVHMIRNAVDHAIEPAAERAAAGKPAVASIKLSAYHEGGSIVVEIADDGRGLPRAAILKKAVERGLIRDGESLSDSDVYNLIFLPGFSTAAKVTEISGRGVGMDVVKRHVEAMRGRIIVLSEPGQGTRFKLVLPLTLAIIDGMLIACGNERYIIPSLAIVESLQPRPEMVRTMADRGELIRVREEILPLLRLNELFGVPSELQSGQGRVVVIESLGRKIALWVDDVINQQQVVIKPLGSGLGNSDCLSGAAILSDGRVGLIVNVDRLGSLGSVQRSLRNTSKSTEIWP